MSLILLLIIITIIECMCERLPFECPYRVQIAHRLFLETLHQIFVKQIKNLFISIQLTPTTNPLIISSNQFYFNGES